SLLSPLSPTKLPSPPPLPYRTVIDGAIDRGITHIFAVSSAVPSSLFVACNCLRRPPAFIKGAVKTPNVCIFTFGQRSQAPPSRCRRFYHHRAVVHHLQGNSEKP
ncbi:hypothetical protein PIB30_093466, partial [Stylosanthes scabra]|nr:hypothetical protein [Stylosanthes scabra]